MTSEDPWTRLRKAEHAKQDPVEMAHLAARIGTDGMTPKAALEKAHVHMQAVIDEANAEIKRIIARLPLNNSTLAEAVVILGVQRRTAMRYLEVGIANLKLEHERLGISADDIIGRAKKGEESITRGVLKAALEAQVSQLSLAQKRRAAGKKKRQTVRKKKFKQ